MPRERVANKDAVAISRRLKELASHRYKSMAGLTRAYKLAARTAKGWMRKVKPSTPDLPFLVRLARKEEISLDWLLLGDGHMLRPNREVKTPYGHMLSLVETELRRSENPTKDEAARAWAHMVTYRTDSSDEGIIDLAVGGVRPFYRETLLRLRVLDRASEMFAGWVEAWQQGENVDDAEARRRADEYSATMSQEFERTMGDLTNSSGRTDKPETEG